MAVDDNSNQSNPTKNMIFIPAVDRVSPSTPVSKETTQRSVAALTSALSEVDSNFDGYLSRDEINTAMPLSDLAVAALAATVDKINEHNAAYPGMANLHKHGAMMDDTILFDRGTITELYLTNPETPGLTPEMINKIIESVLPNGIASIKLSDECNSLPGNVQCTPLPNHKIYISGRNAPST